MNLESEQFMTLLTDALRAGPGSPEWHQAVGALRASGSSGADEMQLLVRARENLESGRDYRTVKAGPGFTRKVLQGIDEEAAAAKPKGLPSANIIALLAGGVILAVVAVMAVVLFRNGTNPGDKRDLDQLRSIYFINPVAQLNVEAATEIGPEWKLIGEVPLKLSKSIGLASAATQPTKDDKREYKAGAIVLAESIPADQARMLDVTLKSLRPTDAIIPEVFVAEGPLDENLASGRRELVWLLKGGTARVALADGTVPVQGEKLDPKKGPTVNVKIRFDKGTVIVESGDTRLYEGAHKLSAAGPRYVGVRFRRKVGDGSDGVWLTTINVLKP
jgi:hypothetical protein